jgi:hypothetical protein
MIEPVRFHDDAGEAVSFHSQRCSKAESGRRGPAARVISSGNLRPETSPHA